MLTPASLKSEEAAREELDAKVAELAAILADAFRELREAPP